MRVRSYWMLLTIFTVLFTALMSIITHVEGEEQSDIRFHEERDVKVGSGRILVIYDDRENICYTIYKDLSNGDIVLVERMAFCHTRLREP